MEKNRPCAGPKAWILSALSFLPFLIAAPSSVAQGMGLPRCPSGMGLMEAEQGFYCVDLSLRQPAGFYGAIGMCKSRGEGYDLCTMDEYIDACGAAIGGRRLWHIQMPRWVRSSDGDNRPIILPPYYCGHPMYVPLGPPSYTAAALQAPLPYRCCLRDPFGASQGIP